MVLADFLILAVVPFLSIYIYCFIKFGFEIRINFMKFNKVAFLLNIFLFMVVFYVMDLYDFKKISGRKEKFSIYC